jgi:hypothetical protein
MGTNILVPGSEKIVEVERLHGEQTEAQGEGQERSACQDEGVFPGKGKANLLHCVNESRCRYPWVIAKAYHRK